MELLKSPLTENELGKIDKFYTLNKNLLTLPENVTNLDTFIQSNEIFLEMVDGLSRFEQTKAWMHLYKLVKSQNTKSQSSIANNKSRSFNNYLSIAITGVILFFVAMPAFYFFVIREPTKSDLSESTSQTMSFEKCTEVQNEMTGALNGTQYKVLAIVDTDIAIIRKYCTNDGVIMLTCSKPDLKLVTTKSANTAGC